MLVRLQSQAMDQGQGRGWGVKEEHSPHLLHRLCDLRHPLTHLLQSPPPPPSPHTPSLLLSTATPRHRKVRTQKYTKDLQASLRGKKHCQGGLNL